MPLSLDKVEAQRNMLIEDQFSKAQIACKKLDHNFQILINNLPSVLLDQNVGELLKSHNHDLNAAIYQEQIKMIDQMNAKTQMMIPSQTQIEKGLEIEEKAQQRHWDPRLEKSPPKEDHKKRVIKNLKKKWMN